MTINEFRDIYRTDKDLHDAAEFYCDTIVIRSYENGNSKDTRRKATKKEHDLLHKIIYSALSAYRFKGSDIDGILNMAEFIGMQLFQNKGDAGINTYDSIYIPLRKITGTGFWE